MEAYITQPAPSERIDASFYAPLFNLFRALDFLQIGTCAPRGGGTSILVHFEGAFKFNAHTHKALEFEPAS